MTGRKSSHKRNLIIACCAFFMLTVFAGAILLPARLTQPKEEAVPTRYEEDIRRLTEESYNAVFFSMYPADTYLPADFAFFRAEDVLITSRRIPDYDILYQYMELAGQSGNNITTVYLGISPARISVEDLTSFITAYPQIHFQVIPAYPSLDYWALLSAEECERILETYRIMLPELLTCENVSVFFFSASEWLIANPANYDGYFQVNKDVAKTLLLYTGEEIDYLIVDEEGCEDALNTLEALIFARRAVPEKYPDLSDWELVFFGDSVIGNFTDSTSIPAIIQGLTNAAVYNLAFGGASAAESDAQTAAGNISLPAMVNAFLTKDTSLLPEGHPQLAGVLSAYTENRRAKKLCFVINFGLNDYFCGLPVASDDLLDSYTFSGAIRSAVQMLQDNYPEAVIVLNTPNFVSIFDDGTEPHGTEGNVLADYASAIAMLADEADCLLLDNYGQLGIDGDNYSDYLLQDRCHPNETGRFLIGEDLVLLLKQYCIQ